MIVTWDMMEGDVMKGPPYEPREVDYIIENYQHMTAGELGLELNRTRSAVQKVIIQLRKAGRLENKCYREDELKYIAEHIGHESITEIANHLGRTFGSVSAKIHKMRKQGLVRDSDYKTYTTKEIRYIIENYGPMTAAEIAINLGRTPKAIERTIARLKANDRFHHHELVWNTDYKGG